MTLLAKPPNPKAETIYHITLNNNRISLISPAKNEEIIKIVKSLGYHWSGSSWQRTINYLAGKVDDGVTELGCHLLANDFIVQLPNETIFQKVINQDYEFECTQWILAANGKYEGWFRLWWKRSKNDFWHTAKNFLSDNRYDFETKCICVPSEHFLEIEDFAQVNEFKFSDKALELLSLAKQRKEKTLTVKIKLKQPERIKTKQETKEIKTKYLDTPYRNFSIVPTSDLYPH